MYLKIVVFTVFIFLLIPQAGAVLAEPSKTLMIQNSLRAAGFNPGPSDGLWGPQTELALSKALKTVGVTQSPTRADGLTTEIFTHLTSAFNLYHETMDLQKTRLQETMSFEDARHLISRTGLGAHPTEIQALVGLTRSAAISREISKLDVDNTQLPPPDFFSYEYPIYWARNDMEEGDQQNFRVARDKEMADLRLWWVREMLATQQPAGERLVLFWHNHFVTAYSGLNENVHVLAKQHWALRKYGHTNFRVLTRAMIHDAAMLDYLDNNSSRKGNPNENLARELMELFVLGEGNYAEKTIKEVARALTGYSVNKLRNDEFEFNVWDHDRGTKTIFDWRGRFDGDDVVDILMRQPATAKFIAQKFWKNYISDFNSDPQQLDAIADAFRASDYDIKTLLRETLSAPQFWAAENRATIIKSPVDLLVGTMRSTGMLPEWWSSIPNRLEQLGQNLFDPPNVAGWPGGSDWLTPSRLLIRNQMIEELLIAEPQVASADGMIENMMTAAPDTPGASNNIFIRYAAEDYEGPPKFRVSAYGNDSRKPIWSSKTTNAKGGIDTELYDRPEFADLNWKIKQFQVPSDLKPDYFSIAFLNDHCCGLSGGDRNFFVDWLAFAGRQFPVAKAKQQTQCSNGNETPGSMYCSGSIEFRDFETLMPSDERVSSNSDGVTAERVFFRGAKEFKSNKNWNAFRIGLVRPHFKGIMVEAMVLRIVRERSNDGSYRTVLQISENNCFPDCIGGPLPRSAHRNHQSGERFLEFALSGRRTPKENRQWRELSKEQSAFVSTLLMSIPDMIAKARKGRSWRQRNGERKFATWKTVFDKIDRYLPRSRHAKWATASKISLRQPIGETGGMMSMMTALNTARMPILLGQPGDKMFWGDFESQLNHAATAKFFLASAPAIARATSNDLGALFADPVFNLK